MQDYCQPSMMGCHQIAMPTPFQGAFHPTINGGPTTGFRFSARNWHSGDVAQQATSWYMEQGSQDALQNSFLGGLYNKGVPQANLGALQMMMNTTSTSPSNFGQPWLAQCQGMQAANIAAQGSIQACMQAPTPQQLLACWQACNGGSFSNLSSMPCSAQVQPFDKNVVNDPVGLPASLYPTSPKIERSAPSKFHMSDEEDVEVSDEKLQKKRMLNRLHAKRSRQRRTAEIQATVHEVEDLVSSLALMKNMEAQLSQAAAGLEAHNALLVRGIETINSGAPLPSDLKSEEAQAAVNSSKILHHLLQLAFQKLQVPAPMVKNGPSRQTSESGTTTTTLHTTCVGQSIKFSEPVRSSSLNSDVFYQGDATGLSVMLDASGAQQIRGQPSVQNFADFDIYDQGKGCHNVSFQPAHSDGQVPSLRLPTEVWDVQESFPSLTSNWQSGPMHQLPASLPVGWAGIKDDVSMNADLRVPSFSCCNVITVDTDDDPMMTSGANRVKEFATSVACANEELLNLENVFEY